MDAEEQLATIYDEIKKLKNAVMIDQALDTGKITDKLHTLEIAMDDLAKETKKKVEDEEKRWRRRIQIVVNNLNKINTFAVELKGEAVVASNEIRLMTMGFILEVAILVGVQVFLDAQRWTLFTLIMLMFFGIIMIAIKAGLDLWRIRRQFKELHEEQDLLHKGGESLIADSKLVPECDHEPQLKVQINEFDKFMSLNKCVAKLSWTYWANFIFFSTFSLAMPILLGFNLDTIVPLLAAMR